MIYPIPNHQYNEVKLGIEDSVSKALVDLNGRFGLSPNASHTFVLDLKDSGEFVVEVEVEKFSAIYDVKSITRTFQKSLTNIQHSAISRFQTEYDRYLTKLRFANYLELFKANMYCENTVKAYLAYSLYFRENLHKLWNLVILETTESRSSTLIIAGIISDWGVVPLFQPDHAFQQ